MKGWVVDVKSTHEIQVYVFENLALSRIVHLRRIDLHAREWCQVRYRTESRCAPQHVRMSNRRTSYDTNLLTYDVCNSSAMATIISISEILDKITDDDKAILVSTLMSPFDVHVNRAHISGEIIHASYYPGKFKIAKGKILTENEKNLILTCTTERCDHEMLKP